MLVRVLMTLEACFALISNSPAIALTRAPLVMAFLPELGGPCHGLLGLWRQHLCDVWGTPAILGNSREVWPVESLTL